LENSAKVHIPCLFVLHAGNLQAHVVQQKCHHYHPLGSSACSGYKYILHSGSNETTLETHS